MEFILLLAAGGFCLGTISVLTMVTVQYEPWIMFWYVPIVLGLVLSFVTDLVAEDQTTSAWIDWLTPIAYVSVGLGVGAIARARERHYKRSQQ